MSDLLTTPPILKGFGCSFRSCGVASSRAKVLIVCLSSLKSRFYIPVREGFANQLDMANIPMETNQGTFPKGDSCPFPFFGNVGTPLMVTLNIPGLNVGLPIWLWSSLNIPNALKAFQMNSLFQGHHMGANFSSYFKEKYGTPFSPPYCKKKSKKRRKRKSKKKKNSIPSSSTSASHVEDEPSATASHAGGISLVTASNTSTLSSTSALKQSSVEDVVMITLSPVN